MFYPGQLVRDYVTRGLGNFNPLRGVFRGDSLAPPVETATTTSKGGDASWVLSWFQAPCEVCRSPPSSVPVNRLLAY